MGRSVHAGVVLFLLLSVVGGIAASTMTHGLLEKEEDEASLLSAANKQHKHKHSGFSEAECPGACIYRCSKTAYKKPCMFFCQKCCFECRCVPPGTYAHKEACPCYNNWKTKRGGPKCP